MSQNQNKPKTQGDLRIGHEKQILTVSSFSLYEGRPWGPGMRALVQLFDLYGTEPKQITLVMLVSE